MKPISISNDIIPVGEFKLNISKWLKSVRDTGQPVVITWNGKPAGVLISPSDYDEFVHNELLLDGTNRNYRDT